MENSVAIPEYTRDDFLSSTGPYEFLYGMRETPFVQRQVMAQLSDMARQAGIRNFATIYKEYVSAMDGQDARAGSGATDFSGQEMELWCGGWQATDAGITGLDRYGMEVTACYHPIMPVQRLVNIDSGIHKVKLAFSLGRRWQYVIEDKSTISDGRSIIGLSRYGIHVTSENARHLVRYLADVEHLNYDKIPETASVGRLGWIEDYGFAPYNGNLVFDGDEEYRTRFEAIRSRGDPGKWLTMWWDIRKNPDPGGTAARIVMAASFASVLVRPCGCLPFFVHLWGGSETGKTVALLVAASVWGDPEIGKYIQTFNATEVGKELGAAFCNSLPLIIDELQLIKDNRKDFDRMIYQLAEGVGRARGKKAGGLQKTPTWRNCIITTGEFPILSPNSGAGAVNRTIEIDCHDTKLFQDAKSVALCMYENYGYAGRTFINKLEEPGALERVRALQADMEEKLKTDDTMDKQTASASLILTADQLMDEWIFQDGVRLKPEDLRPYLTSRSITNQNARALDYLEDFVNINQARFSPEGDNGEVWGDLEDGGAWIIKSKFDQILSDEGYNAASFIGWARENGVIDCGPDGRPTRAKRIHGRVTRCVHIKFDNCSHGEDISDEILPL